MDTFTYIPIDTGSDTPSKCPKCHNIENKKTVCRSCDYEYPEDSEPLFLFVGGGITIIYIFCTLVAWGVSDDTLVNIFFEQAEWIVKLAGRIV